VRTAPPRISHEYVFRTSGLGLLRHFAVSDEPRRAACNHFVQHWRTHVCVCARALFVDVCFERVRVFLFVWQATAAMSVISNLFRNAKVIESTGALRLLTLTCWVALVLRLHLPLHAPVTVQSVRSVLAICRCKQQCRCAVVLSMSFVAARN
jgi:hypothetical protein